MGEVAGIWPPGHPAHLGHVGDVIRSVICDARGEAVARAVRPGLLDGMRELEERVEALYGEIIPEGEADYEEDAIMGIVRLSDAVIGPKPEGRKPSLYLVNGRHLVVGRGRADVRRVMMGFGLSPHPGHQPRREVRGRAHRRGHYQDSRARPGAHRTHGGVSMSQSHEKQLVEALRGILATGDDGTSLERDEKILKAIKEELAPLVELAATPHREYMDEKAAALYCSIPIQSLQKKRHHGHGPVYIKDGTKVLYARKDLERYMEQRKVKTCDR